MIFKDYRTVVLSTNNGGIRVYCVPLTYSYDQRNALKVVMFRQNFSDSLVKILTLKIESFRNFATFMKISAKIVI